MAKVTIEWTGTYRVRHPRTNETAEHGNYRLALEAAALLSRELNEPVPVEYNEVGTVTTIQADVPAVDDGATSEPDDSIPPEPSETNPEPDEPVKPIPPAPEPPAVIEVTGTLDGNPSFNVASLEGSGARLWYKRAHAAIEHPDPYEDILRQVRNADDYHLARSVHQHVQALLFGLRFTGDLRFLDAADSLLEIARADQQKRWRGTIGDPDNVGGDGTPLPYPAWVYKGAGGNDPHYVGRDTHPLNGPKTAAMIAMTTYAFERNRGRHSPNLVNYGKRADSWKAWLKAWEARHRGGHPRAFGGVNEWPLRHKDSNHTNHSWLMWHFYMHKLFEEQPYIEGATALALHMWSNAYHLVDTQHGSVLTWQHHSPAKDGKRQAMPYTYARYPALDILELHLEGFERYAAADVPRAVARLLSHVLYQPEQAENPSGRQADLWARDTTGGRTLGRLPASDSSWKRGTVAVYAISPYAMFMGWDDTSELKRQSEIAYERMGYGESPKSIHLPVAFLADAVRRRL